MKTITVSNEVFENQMKTITVSNEVFENQIRTGLKTGHILMGRVDVKKGDLFCFTDRCFSSMVDVKVDEVWQGLMQDVPPELLDRCPFSSLEYAIGYTRTEGRGFESLCERSSVTIMCWREVA